MVHKINSMIAGLGSATGKHTLTNADLEKIVDTSDEWIQTRTGIKYRQIVKEEDGIGNSDLGTEAATQAIKNAGIKPSDIDIIINGTVTPDMLFPATACFVQDKLGANNAAAFDISAACSGFIYGLSIADSFIQTGKAKTVLVIGSEILTSITDWEDRNTCVLFGDAAGAAIVVPSDGEKGILATHIKSNGSLWHLLNSPIGSKNRINVENVQKKMHLIKMEGREVFKHAIFAMMEGVDIVLERSGLTNEDIDLLIPHQANIRIIEGIAKRYAMANGQVFINVDRYGNTSAASIPLAMTEAIEQGLIKDGTIVAATAFGAGFTWGAGLFKF